MMKRILMLAMVCMVVIQPAKGQGNDPEVVLKSMTDILARQFPGHVDSTYESAMYRYYHMRLLDMLFLQEKMTSEAQKRYAEIEKINQKLKKYKDNHEHKLNKQEYEDVEIWLETKRLRFKRLLPELKTLASDAKRLLKLWDIRCTSEMWRTLNIIPSQVIPVPNVVERKSVGQDPEFGFLFTWVGGDLFIIESNVSNDKLNEFIKHIPAIIGAIVGGVFFSPEYGVVLGAGLSQFIANLADFVAQKYQGHTKLVRVNQLIKDLVGRSRSTTMNADLYAQQTVTRVCELIMKDEYLRSFEETVSLLTGSVNVAINLKQEIAAFTKVVEAFKDKQVKEIKKNFGEWAKETDRQMAEEIKRQSAIYDGAIEYYVTHLRKPSKLIRKTTSVVERAIYRYEMWNLLIEGDIRHGLQKGFVFNKLDSTNMHNLGHWDLVYGIFKDVISEKGTK